MLKRTITFLLLFFTCLPCLLHAEQSEFSAKEELVLAKDANLRKGPGISFDVIDALRKGTRVKIIYQVGEWTRVEQAGGNKNGWLHLPVPANTSTAEAAPAPPDATRTKTIEPVPMKESRQPAKKTGEPARPAQLVGVIDIQQVINQSKRGRAAREKYEELRRSGQENIDQTEEKIISGVIIEIQAVVETYARNHGFTHVINKNSGSMFYFDGNFNITADIISEYDRQAALSQQQIP
ncbi:MAG: OmpH family outer membrane protein [Pseudomonadota bacterium]